MNPSVNPFLNVNGGDNQVKIFECFQDLVSKSVTVVHVAPANLAAKAATDMYDEERKHSRTNHVDAMIADAMKLTYQGNDFLFANVEGNTAENVQRGPVTDELLVSKELYRISEHIIKSQEITPAIGIDPTDEKVLRRVGTYFCPICLDLFRNPTSTRCGHIFCKECLRLHLTVHAPRANNCPTCWQHITKRTSIKVFLPDVDFRARED